MIGITLAWLVLSRDWNVQHPDLGFYQHVADATSQGQVPYRDFDPAYPPAALPILVLPSRLGSQPGIWEGYALRFEHLMLIIGWLLVVAVAAGLAALDATRRRTVLALGLVAVSPILVGPILPARFDLWPAALTTVGLAAILARRERIGGAVLGLAIAAKVYPIVVVPLVLLYLWRRRGARAAVGSGAVLLATVAAVAFPFAILAPDGLWRSLHDFMVRPLQVESLGASVLWVAHQVLGTRLDVATGFGSDNLVGPLPDVAVLLQEVALAVALIAVWARFARERMPTDELLITASAVAVCAFVVFGKVLSGQYLVWLIPLVALLDGRRAVPAALALVAALLLMQQWYPARYPAWIAGNDPGVSWLVLARDLTLLGLLATLAAPATWLDAVADSLAWRFGPIMGGLVPRRRAFRPAYPAPEPGRVAIHPAFTPVPERLRKER